MISINVRADIRRVTRNLRLSRKQIGAMARRAINKAGKMNQTAMARDVSKLTSLRVTKVKADMILRSAQGNDLGRMFSRLKSRRAPQKLSYFTRPTQTARGVMVTAWGVRKLYQNTFLATMDSGHVGIFSRAKRGEKRVGRIPLHELHGPEIPETMALREVMDRARARSSEIFIKELRRLAAMEIGR